MNAHPLRPEAAHAATVYIRPVVLTIKQSQAYAQLGRTKLFELIKCGVLDGRRNGTKTVITVASLDAYLAALPNARDAKVEEARRHG
jgi:hypothetical protein